MIPHFDKSREGSAVGKPLLHYAYSKKVASYILAPKMEEPNISKWVLEGRTTTTTYHCTRQAAAGKSVLGNIKWSSWEHREGMSFLRLFPHDYTAGYAQDHKNAPEFTPYRRARQQPAPPCTIPSVTHAFFACILRAILSPGCCQEREISQPAARRTKFSLLSTKKLASCRLS